MQSIVAAGGYHPSLNETMVQRVSVPYQPQAYPPPYLQAQGYKCSCGQFYDNICRSEFRNVRHAGRAVVHATCAHQRLSRVLHGQRMMHADTVCSHTDQVQACQVMLHAAGRL